MSPLTVFTGIVMGSAVTIALGLAMTLAVFMILSGQHPQLTREYGTLLTSFGLFFALALAAAYAFVGVLRRRTWRWYAQAATWVLIAAIGLYYWPR
jgi:hypothetical protein